MARLDAYEAVLFDLDGVLTSTADQHYAAWKTMFDDFLAEAASSGGAFTRGDYHRYVDGIPRYDGVRNFLQSRDIRLPEGAPTDPPTARTVCGLGNRKNILVNEIIATEGVDVYPGSLLLVEQLRGQRMPMAVVSSSRNCQTVLEAAGIADLFAVRVDGEIAAALGLPGKPAPDTFLRAAHALGVEASYAVVVEDALLGVQAGRAGGFGLVIGVDRVGQAEALREAGADLVVADLDELVDADLPPAGA